MTNRMKAFDAAMELSADENPLMAMAQVMAMTRSIERFLDGNEPFAEQKADDAPTAEGPTDEIQFTGEAEQQASDWGTGDGKVIAIVGDKVVTTITEPTAEVAEAMQTVGERITKAVASRKAKAAKKSKAKKARAPREAAPVETGTESHTDGNPVPNGADPVPETTTELPQAA